MNGVPSAHPSGVSNGSAHADVPGAGVSALRTRYVNVRRATMELAAYLTAEDCQLQSMPDASPTKWHLAHTTWFFETFVVDPLTQRHRPAARHVPDPVYRVLFNSYYNGIGDQHPRASRGQISRPTLSEVMQYRRRIDGAMVALLDDVEADAEAVAVVEIGLQHEQQHQELILTDILHAMSCNPLEPVVRPGHAPGSVIEAPPQGWFHFDGGQVAIGHAGDGFCFDNEMPAHQALLYPFLIASRPVTGGEFMAFIADGGYERAELWLSNGWDAVQRERWCAPLYWQQDDNGWTQLTLRGRRPVDVNAPVCHVSYYEADAYARWACARLPTEFEWEHAARSQTVSGNFADGPWVAGPAPASAPAATALQQMYGDVWEWTASAYLPYPGYRAAPGALGEYNGKFMSDQWVLRGGSLATPPDHIRATYRNFFPGSARWQFSGFRLACDAG